MGVALTSPTLSLRARGPLACYTRPELKAERVSYPVMTPSAARGLLEAVLWKPAILWRIERIKVLTEIEFIAFRRNEVARKMPLPKQAVQKNGGVADQFFADEEDTRAQRNTVALKNVDYVVEAQFIMTDKAGSDDNVKKFVEMFQRRVEKGQHFHQPYLGCREFIAEVLPANDHPKPIQEDRDLGLMLWDIEYGRQRNTPLFFEARLEKGVLIVPTETASLFSRREKGEGV